MRSCCHYIDTLYDDPQRQDKTFFQEDVEYGEAVTASQLEGEFKGNGDSEEDASEDTLRKERKKFLRMQANINQVSARPPAFAEARDGLQLEVTKNDAEPDRNGTGSNYTMDYKGLELKPWQSAGMQ